MTRIEKSNKIFTLNYIKLNMQSEQKSSLTLKLKNPPLQDVSTDPAHPKWQFNGKLGDNVTSAGFMLNTDFELVYDLTLDPATGRTTCILNTTCGYTKECDGFCPRAKTFRQSREYSKVIISNFSITFRLELTTTSEQRLFWGPVFNLYNNKLPLNNDHLAIKFWASIFCTQVRLYLR